MWICCCCSAVFLGYKWFSVKKVNDHEDRFEKFFRLQGQLRNSVLFRGNEGLKLYILYIRVFSNWVRKIKKMSIQGYNRKHEATRGCLGNLLLLLFRKWAKMIRHVMLIFRSQVMGLLWRSWTNCYQGQFWNYGTLW
ncbi:hypothetical protein LXL04_015907, partial [Taraxacum kok-saghyz]